MNKPFALAAVLIAAMLFSCASPPLEEALQPSAVKVAQQRGATELGCPAATTEVLSKSAIQETTGGWSDTPRRAEYTVSVSGCGKHTTYLVACNKFHSACDAGPVPIPTGPGALGQLADELQPDAIKAAQQRGSKDFACPTTTAEVTRQETIVEGQTTGGWGTDVPHRAAYAVTVHGCGKQTVYLVECDKQEKACATGGLQQTQAGPQYQQLADELQPSAVLLAKERGSKELECPAATAEVNRKETIEEGPQPVGISPRIAPCTP